MRSQTANTLPTQASEVAKMASTKTLLGRRLVEAADAHGVASVSGYGRALALVGAPAGLASQPTPPSIGRSIPPRCSPTESTCHASAAAEPNRIEMAGADRRRLAEHDSPRNVPPHPAHIPPVRNSGNSASRAHPARGRRKLTPSPGNPRTGRAGKPCSRRESPPIPAQPGSPKTGLSRRRSRVRVPSLPLLTPRFFSRRRASSSAVWK